MSGASNADPSKAAEAMYPSQRHAGKVGYGPNYNVGASFAEMVGGLTEEIKGRLKHDPELVHRGHELHTGELKRKQLLDEGGKDDPAFLKGQDEEKKKQGKAQPKSKSDTNVVSEVQSHPAEEMNHGAKEAVSRTAGAGLASPRPAPQVEEVVTHSKTE